MVVLKGNGSKPISFSFRRYFFHRGENAFLSEEAPNREGNLNSRHFLFSSDIFLSKIIFEISMYTCTFKFSHVSFDISTGMFF